MKAQLYRNIVFGFVSVAEAGALDKSCDYVAISEPVNVEFTMIEGINVESAVMASFDDEKEKALSDIKRRREKALSALSAKC